MAQPIKPATPAARAAPGDAPATFPIRARHLRARVRPLPPWPARNVAAARDAQGGGDGEALRPAARALPPLPARTDAPSPDGESDGDTERRDVCASERDAARDALAARKAR